MAYDKAQIAVRLLDWLRERTLLPLADRRWVRSMYVGSNFGGRVVLEFSKPIPRSFSVASKSIFAMNYSYSVFFGIYESYTLLHRSKLNEFSNMSSIFCIFRREFRFR